MRQRILTACRVTTATLFMLFASNFAALAPVFAAPANDKVNNGNSTVKPADEDACPDLPGKQKAGDDCAPKVTGNPNENPTVNSGNITTVADEDACPDLPGKQKAGDDCTAPGNSANNNSNSNVASPNIVDEDACPDLPGKQKAGDDCAPKDNGNPNNSNANSNTNTVAPVALVATDKKVTICHRDANVKKPYGPKPITVDQDSADGNAGNDNGKGDHYLEHNEPAFDPDTTYGPSDKWGDIIPPIPGVHNGLNWTAYGQATFENDCQPPTKVAAAAVTFKTPTCEVNSGSYTVPTAAKGVQYQSSLNGGAFQNVTEGTFTVPAGSTVTVKAVPQDKTYFVTGTTSWSSSFPAVSQADCVLGSTTGGRGGDVLGASTELANTGAGGSPILSVMVGLLTLALALGTTLVARKQYNS